MFDRIFDVLINIWDWVSPFVIVNVFERGVILRFGKFHREIGPGIAFKIPFADVPQTCTVVRQTEFFDVQSLTSGDGKTVTLNGVAQFKIFDVKTLLLDIDEGLKDVINLLYGEIEGHVTGQDWEYIITEDWNEDVFQAAKELCKGCGVELLTLGWADKAIARNIRLWNN